MGTALTLKFALGVVTVPTAAGEAVVIAYPLLVPEDNKLSRIQDVAEEATQTAPTGPPKLASGAKPMP